MDSEKSPEPVILDMNHNRETEEGGASTEQVKLDMSELHGTNCDAVNEDVEKSVGICDVNSSIDQALTVQGTSSQEDETNLSLPEVINEVDQEIQPAQNTRVIKGTDENQNIAPEEHNRLAAQETVPLPPVNLDTDGDIPEVCTDGQAEFVGSGDSDARSDIPPDSAPELPSLSGIIGDHAIIDDPPPSPPPPKVYEIYPERKSRIAGLVQIGLGLISIACQAVAIYYSEPETYENDGYNYFGTGIWCGMFFIAAGIVCIVTVYKKTRKMISANLVISGLSAVIFTVALFVMACLCLAQSNFHSRYKCRVEEDEPRALCTMNRPLLIADVTMLIVAILEMFITIKMALHCYRTILAKKRDQLQYIRTPEGVLMVMNKGPDYTDISANPIPTVCLRTNTGDILYPMQAQAVLKPPPYPVDASGELISPPSYQGSPPEYSDIERSKSPSLHSILTKLSNKGNTTAAENGVSEADSTEKSHSRSSSVTVDSARKMPFTDTDTKTPSPSHSRQASISSSIASESNCVVMALPDPYDKITVLEDKGDSRPRGYFAPPVTENPDHDPVVEENTGSDTNASGNEASGDSNDDYSTIDSRTSSVEYPHVIVVDSDEQETVHL